MWLDEATFKAHFIASKENDYTPKNKFPNDVIIFSVWYYENVTKFLEARDWKYLAELLPGANDWWTYVE